MLEGIKVLTHRRLLTAEVKPHRRNPIADATLNTYEVFSAPSQVWLTLKSKQPELLKCTQPARQIAGLVLYFTQLYFISLSGPWTIFNQQEYTPVSSWGRFYSFVGGFTSTYTQKSLSFLFLLPSSVIQITTFTRRSALCPSRLLFGF